MERTSINRFTSRAANYDKYRPTYPETLVAFINEFIGLSNEQVVADFAAGTGIFTKLLAAHPNTVYVVEPNLEMLSLAKIRLDGFPNCIFVAGAAEKSPLAGESLDLITVAQAYHWLDPQKTRQEFRRILKPDGHVALIWNRRNTDAPFERGYEQLIQKYSTDYHLVNQRRLEDLDITSFFAPNIPAYRIFEHTDNLSLEQAIGRTQSYSYMPETGTPEMARVIAELTQLFDHTQANGWVKLSYQTRLFIGKLS